MNSNSRDLVSELLTKYAAAAASATAGGSGDNTETTGVSIDISALGRRAESVCFMIAATATLAAAATLVVAAKIEHSDDNTNWEDLVASATVLTLTGGSGGTTERGTAKIGKSLEYAKKYIRLKFTPNLSAANTDTAALQAIACFAGLDRQPAA